MTNKLVGEFSFFPNKTEWEKEVLKTLKSHQTLNDLVWKSSDLSITIPAFTKPVDGTFSDAHIMYPKAIKIAQLFVIHNNLEKVQREITLALEHGIQSLHFVVKQIIEAKDWEIVFQGVFLSMLSIHIQYDDEKLYNEGKSEWIKFTNTHSYTENLKGSFTLKQALSTNNQLASLKTVEIHEKTLAQTLHKAHLFISDGLTNGFSFDELNTKIQFKLIIGIDFFTAISELKALRILWNEITQAYQIQPKENAYIIADLDTSSYQTGLADIHNNLIQETWQTTSAFLGGADELVIPSFDVAKLENESFTQRISRNIVHILKEESFLEASNPLKGAYAIDLLTQKIVEKNWNDFLALEQNTHA